MFKTIIIRFRNARRRSWSTCHGPFSSIQGHDPKAHFSLSPVKPALDQMQKKYRLGIVSNAQEAFTMPELALYELGPYFETIVLSSQAGVKKPNSRIFTRALSDLNVKPKKRYSWETTCTRTRWAPPGWA